MVATTYQCKDPRNHCNIDGHTEEKCWMLYPKLNQKNKKKDNKKKNLIATDSSNHVERNSDVDEKIINAEGGEFEQPSTIGRERNDQTLPYKDIGQEDKD